jgi:ABC-2 type transport system ATP-binding protein
VVVHAVGRGALEVHGLTSELIGEAAARGGIALHELTPLEASLEDAFMRLTGEELEFHAGALGEAA